MMKIDIKKVISVVAWFSIIYGLWYFLKSLRPTYRALIMGYDPAGPWSLKYYIYIILITLALCILIPIIRIVGGFLLLKIKPLGAKFIILVSILDFVLGLSAAFNRIFLSIYPIQMPKLDVNTTVIKISVWPVYVLALIDLSVIYFLNRSDVKKLFGG